MQVLIEYNAKYGFRKSYLEPKQELYGADLYSDGWRLVCLIDEERAEESSFKAYLDYLECARPSYKIVEREVRHCLKYFD